MPSINSANQIISIKYNEDVISANVNKKFLELSGGCAILSGLTLSKNVYAVNIAPGKCTIAGSSIEEPVLLTLAMPAYASATPKKVYIVVSYTHGPGAVASYSTSDTAPVSPSNLYLGEVTLASNTITEVVSYTSDKLRTMKDLSSGLTSVESELFSSSFINSSITDFCEKTISDTDKTFFEESMKGISVINRADIGINHANVVVSGVGTTKGAFIHLVNNAALESVKLNVSANTTGVTGSTIVYKVLEKTLIGALKLKSVADIPSAIGINKYYAPAGVGTTLWLELSDTETGYIDFEILAVLEGNQSAPDINIVGMLNYGLCSAPACFVEVTRSANLFNGDFIKGKSISVSTGAITNTADGYITQSIRVAQGQPLYYGGNNRAVVRFENEDKTLHSFADTPSIVPINAHSMIVYFYQAGYSSGFFVGYDPGKKMQAEKHTRLVEMIKTDGLKSIGPVYDELDMLSSSFTKKISDVVNVTSFVLKSLLSNTKQWSLMVNNVEFNLTNLTTLRDLSVVKSAYDIILANEDVVGNIGKIHWASDGTLRYITDKATVSVATTIPITYVLGIVENHIVNLRALPVFDLGQYEYHTAKKIKYTHASGSLSIPEAHAICSVTSMATLEKLTSYTLSAGSLSSTEFVSGCEYSVVAIVKNGMKPVISQKKPVTTRESINAIIGAIRALSLSSEDSANKAENLKKIVLGSKMVRYHQSGVFAVDSAAFIFNIGEYNPNTDDVDLYIGGILQIEDIDYAIDKPTSTITKIGTIPAFKKDWLWMVVLLKNVRASGTEIIDSSLIPEIVNARNSTVYNKNFSNVKDRMESLEVSQNISEIIPTTTGTVPAFAVTIPGFVYAAGKKVTVKFHAASTVVSTLNINGSGAKGVKQGNGTSDVVDIKVGIYTLVCDGTSYVVPW